jgi:hypothetical protein
MRKMLESLECETPSFPVGDLTAVFPSVNDSDTFDSLIDCLDEREIKFVDYGAVSGYFAMNFNSVHDAVLAKLAFP